MNELRVMVMRFVDGKMDLSSFRDAFVRRFLTSQSSDSRLWQTVLEIESTCADYSEGLVASESDLRFQLARIVQPIRAAAVMNAGVFGADFGDLVAEAPATVQPSSSGRIAISPIETAADISVQFA